MLFINGGMPRSGTVLVGLILRKIFEAEKLSFTSLNLHGNALDAFLENYASSRSFELQNYIVHTHTWSTKFFDNPNKFHIFWNYREPRDVVVSVMRLHDMPFNESLRFVIGSINDGGLMLNKQRVLVPYELLASFNVAYIQMISNIVGCPLNPSECETIARSVSVEAVEKKVSRVVAGAEGVREVKNRRRILLEDSETFLNDRHVQSGSYKRYINELSAQQAAEATKALLPFLNKYGYPEQ